MALATVGLAGLGCTPSASADDQVVPLPGIFRGCSFTAKTFVPTDGDGRAFAVISPIHDGTVTAQVQIATARPGTQYVVRLIQTPRPSIGCGPTDPGVATAALNTDGVGAAAVTVQAPALPGTTGAWVSIDLPSEYSQTPLEHYTSDYIAPI
ncbi:hypothetical protein MMAD_02380 [Mycolicibacterium madagascariense]|uniref:Lipoprotein n=1 Tax=Mycolicibacterium madagascariense TaxID=212765 RepID=A0A7I7XAI2_9MYCO|nr:hypothetical protein [Mycolicibacterium madagascariense]MCV7015063.1 hypothetical protein [Mycolicibacterium madagascariense]BBZ25943.1 hypothetical protein MMAD_02380 [Mycolicibacterium madagascariense]